MRKYKQAYNKTYGIYVLIFVLVISQAGITQIKNVKAEEKNKKLEIMKDPNIPKRFEISKYIEVEIENPKPQEFVVTAYDLSVQSTGKSRGNPSFGITKDGTNLRGENWKSARAIAVDPNIIPLGSKVLIEFVDDEYEKYNNTYSAIDIGGGIVGNHIDLFLGDFNSSKPSKKVISFGKTTAYVTILD